jgi:hypothetical protein
MTFQRTNGGLQRVNVEVLTLRRKRTPPHIKGSMRGLGGRRNEVERRLQGTADETTSQRAGVPSQIIVLRAIQLELMRKRGVRVICGRCRDQT